MSNSFIKSLKRVKYMRMDLMLPAIRFTKLIHHLLTLCALQMLVLLLLFNCHFPGELRIAGSPHLFRKSTLEISCTRVLWARCSTYHPNNSVEAPTQTGEISHWPHPFFIHRRTLEVKGKLSDPNWPTTTTTTVLRPFFRDHWVSRCQKRTSGLYGARED